MAAGIKNIEISAMRPVILQAAAIREKPAVDACPHRSRGALN
jgi:hypothetical protein